MSSTTEQRTAQSLTDAALEALLGKSPRSHVRTVLESPEAAQTFSPDTIARFRTVSDTLHRANQRHDLLQALLTVTRELTSVRGQGETLSLLVRLTRSLLRSDMAYVSLNDPATGTTYIQETDGVLTEGYRTIRMPLGEGVLGRVAAAGGPYQTSNYLEDPAVEAEPDIRRRVSEEGVRGIMGAPIRIAGRLIGALLVADRQRRTYDAGEVAVLDSLATHAAAVIENSRLFEELNANLQRAEQARVDAARRVAELTTLNDAETVLMATLATLSSPEQFSAKLREVLQGDAIAVESRHLADALPGRPPAGLVVYLERRLLAAAQTGDEVEIDPLYREDEEPGERLFFVPAAISNRLLGAVGMRGPVSPTQRLILQRAALVFGSLLSFQRALEASGAWERSELVDSLTAGRPAQEYTALANRAEDFGLDFCGPVVTVIVDPVVASVHRVSGLISQLAENRGVTSIRNGQVIALINADNAEELAIAWAHRLASRGLNSTVAAESVALDGHGGREHDRSGDSPHGAVSPETTIGSIPEAYQSTASVLSAALRLGRRGEPCTRAMLGVAALVVGADSRGITRRIVHFAIGALVDYDRQRGTGLVDTALAFLDSNQKVSAAAKTLHLHENTVRQRLARIDELLGLEWRQGTKCLDTHMALRLHQLSRSDDHTI